MSSAPCSALPEPDLACRTSATTVANHPSWHCGTGIVPDRDITGSWRDVDEPYVSLPAVSPSRARTHRVNCRLFDTGRRNLAREGLSAGGRWIRTFSTAARITEAAATAALRDQIRHAFGPVRLHRLDRKAPIQVWCNPDFRDRAPCSPRPRPGELDRNRRTCAGAQAEAVSSARRRAWLDGCPRPSCSTMPNAGRGAALISPSRKRPRQGPATGARRRSRVDRARAASPVAPGSRTAVSGAPATPWSSSGPRPGRPGGGRRRS